jgi:hypothetical protein
VAEAFFNLSESDRSEVLEVAAATTGRPAHLLEKDVWVVWALSALFQSPIGADLTFKGGTSLSKAYKIIDRFSEDIDLTYDIRKLLPDLVSDGDGIPPNKSQARKWTNAVRQRLPAWIGAAIAPVIRDALTKDGLPAEITIGGDEKDKLFINYDPLKRGSGYVGPQVLLEFGARATGEPNEILDVTCDMEGHVQGVVFPMASPCVMRVERTFWEKATAAHVYCAQGRIRGERFARHWHDLAILMQTEYFEKAIVDRAVAQAVAEHKSFFFAEKAADGTDISYQSAVHGQLTIVPQGESRTALQADYAKMAEDGILLGQTLSFDELMLRCEELQLRANEKSQQA